MWRHGEHLSNHELSPRQGIAAMKVMAEAVKLSVTALDVAGGSCQHAVSQDLQGLQSSAVFFA